MRSAAAFHCRIQAELARAAQQLAAAEELHARTTQQQEAETVARLLDQHLCMQVGPAACTCITLLWIDWVGPAARMRAQLLMD